LTRQEQPAGVIAAGTLHRASGPPSAVGLCTTNRSRNPRCDAASVSGLCHGVETPKHGASKGKGLAISAAASAQGRDKRSGRIAMAEAGQQQWDPEETCGGHDAAPRRARASSAASTMLVNSPCSGGGTCGRAAAVGARGVQAPGVPHPGPAAINAAQGAGGAS
jgi:hypothetical protein